MGRNPKMQAFLDAGGDNAPRYEYLVFLHEMKKRYIEARAECGCQAPIDEADFTRFVVAAVASGARYNAMKSEITGMSKKAAADINAVLRNSKALDRALNHERTLKLNWLQQLQRGEMDRDGVIQALTEHLDSVGILRCG